MNYCTNCGHELGVGRFCTNCGQPVAGRHPGTPVEPRAAEPPIPPPPTLPPPVVGSIPPPPRFPLYAEPTPLPPRRRSLLPWLVVVLALVVIGAGVGAVLLFRSGAGTAAVDASPSGAAASPPTGSKAPTTPSQSGTSDTSDTDLTADISHVGVPGTAPASTDLAGSPVTFGSGNLVDGDSQTAWRVAGDASGKALTVTFDKPVRITSVGLINGYAKSYRGYNGYRLNRRIAEVRWTFENGTTVTQLLQERPTMQSVAVTTGPTSSLRLEIVSTIASPQRNWRDFTAISELSLRGTG